MNSDEANKSISKTEKNASNFASKLGSGIKTAAKWGTAIVGAASAAGAGLLKFAESAASTSDNIDKMSQKIGVSRQAYQELDFICSQSGTSVDKLKSGMKTLVFTMDSAAQGANNSIQKFKELGVEYQNTDGSLRNSEEVMWDTLSALQNISNETERSRMAVEMFGKSGQELMPLLNGGAGSIEEMKEKAHELGLVLEDEVIDSGVSLTDTIDRVKRAFSGIVTRLGAILMPIVEKGCNMVIGYMPQIQSLALKLSPILTGFLDKIVPPLGELASVVVPQLITLLTMLMPVVTNLFSALAPIIVQLISMLLPAIVQIIQRLLPPLMRIINAVLPLLSTLFDLFSPIIGLILNLVGGLLTSLLTALAPVIEKLAQFLNQLLTPLIPVIQQICDIIFSLFSPLFEALSPIFDKLLLALMPVLELFAALLNELLPYLIPIIEWLAGVLSNVLGTSLDTVFGLLDSFVLILSGIIDFIKGVFSGDWEQAWRGILEVFWGNFNGIANIAESVVNGVIDLLNAMISSWSWLFDTLGWGSVSIPHVHLQQQVSIEPTADFKERSLSGGRRLRGGIDEVPYDKFPAMLDAGEMVLTAQEAEKYRASKNTPAQATEQNITQDFTIEIKVDKMDNGTDIDTLVKKISQKLAAEVRRKEYRLA